MRGFIKYLKCYMPSYYGYVWLSILFNLLGAIFGAFSFVALSPVLGILFGTQETVEHSVEWAFSVDSIKKNLYYLISEVIRTEGRHKALLYINIFIVIAVFFKVGFAYVADVVTVPIRNGISRDMRNRIYKKVLSLPMGFFSEAKKGDIIARMANDVSEVERSIIDSLKMLFKNPMLILISLAAMFIMSWSLTLFVLLLLPLVGYFIGRVGKSLKKPSGRGQKKMGVLLSITEESISGLRIVKAFNAEDKMNTRFRKENTLYYNIMNKLLWRQLLAQPMSELLGTIVIVIVLWYGGRLVIDAQSGLSAQGFITYLVFFYSIISPSKAFSTAIYSINKGLASVERIDEVMNAKNNIKNKDNALPVTGFNKEIEYRNVSFSYGSTNVLKDINLTIPKGSTIALVGSSGSGKSTFVDLLPRFWDVTDGQILIDGKDIRELDIAGLRGLMGNVNQEPILFNDSFYNNITFGVDSVAQDEVEAAATVANAHEFITTTRDGYFSGIGDRGAKLSGGQRQRISVARAVLKNPPIMILDEATSALDTESERLVQKALENLMKNRTSIVIAHRLSTIKSADKICVFSEGRIVESGTHEELLKLGGAYKRLHTIQSF